MTHAEMSELYELYALGVLEPELAAEIERHLNEQCEYCWEHLRSAMQVTAALAGTAEPVSPPRALRRRLLDSVRHGRPAAIPSFAVFAFSAAALACFVFFITWQVATHSTQKQIDALRHERDQLRAAIEVLSRPETRSVEFGKTENGPHGRVLLSGNGGIVFVGSQLPQLPAHQTFEMWLVPANGAPKPAGLFRPNSAGDSVNVSPLPLDGSTKAVAVSIEPERGSNEPTTKPILVVPLG